MGHVTRRAIPAALLAAGALLAGGCQSQSISDRSLQFVDPDGGMALVGTRTNIFGASRTGVWVDGRSEKAYQAGHIPGAINVPYRGVRQQRDRLAEYDVLIVYGGDYNSSLAIGMSKTLLELGFAEVHTLRGGLRAWTDAGHPVEVSQAGSEDGAATRPPRE